MKPAISIDSESLTAELFQMTWFLYGLEKTMESWHESVEHSPLTAVPRNTPLIPMAGTVQGTNFPRIYSKRDDMGQ